MPSVSSGKFDRIEKIEDWEKANGVPTKAKIMDAIPAHLKKRCAFTSSLYLARDIFYLAVVSLAFHQLSCVPFVKELLETSYLFTLLFWGSYAAIQGTVATGVWVVGHECGHHAFAESDFVNDAVGFLTHTPLLVPFFAWQYTHGKHHKFTNHTLLGETHVPPVKPNPWHEVRERIEDLFGEAGEVFGTWVDVASHLVGGWPLYLLLNVTGGRTDWKGEKLERYHFGGVLLGGISHYVGSSGSQIFPPQWHKRVTISAVGSIGMLGLLYMWANAMGFTHMFKWYFAPYMVTNMWLVLYTWLQHTHEDVPHLGKSSFSWLRGALSTIDRPYPWIFDHLHHQIGSTHVMHHLNSRIPHYHAEAATECIKPLLGELYRYDERSIWTALWATSRRCEFVGGVEGVQWFVQRETENQEKQACDLKERKRYTEGKEAPQGKRRRKASADKERKRYTC